MASEGRPTYTWDAVRRLFLAADDPLAGADLPSSRNAVAVLCALHGLLVALFLPLFPPDATSADTLGWLIAIAGVAVNFGASAFLLLERKRVWFGVMLAVAYFGIVQLLTLEYLAQTALPYQLLLLVWVGAGAVQPSRRALTLLAALVVAALAPVIAGQVEENARDQIGLTLLFAAVGLVLIAYVGHVRAQRVALRLQEREARAEAAAATARVRGLQWITDAALAPAGLDELLQEVVKRIVKVLDADQGSVLLRSADGAMLALSGSEGLPQPPEELNVPLGEGLPGRVAMAEHALATERLDKGGGPLEAVLAAAGVQSVLGTALVAERNMLGILLVGTQSRRSFTDDDTAFLQLIGDRVALAIERARLFERERHIAETLQRSLLPESLPPIPGTQIAVRYRPAGQSAAVGGDWYDTLELADGRIVLVMGDVMGRGVGAAALMGKLRTSLEAYALDGHSPEEVLKRLNSLMDRQHRTEMATLLYVVVDPDERCAFFASAGHTPLLLREADGATSFVADDRSPPLGALAYAHFKQTRIDLRSGSTLLLFTDGLVERHDLSMSIGLQRLQDVVDEGPNAPDPLCDHVLDLMLGDDEPHDDVALLAFQLTPLPMHGFTLTLPAEPEAVPSVRRALERWLGEGETPGAEAYAIKVACGEACSNAIEHAYRPGDAAFQVDAKRQGEEIAVAIRDFGQWRDKREDDRGRGLLLMESLMDSVEIDPSAEGTTVRMRRRLGSA